ncbi:serine/threonine-protein kinase [Marilutibacter chinensis]|uniref:Serine/threonine-protein kinase n=1 Tax=Marilutibacter chinensis TaxID=2912247 RepID=A0ABS9HQN6_9GAMM|nr:serine/threonine-protein kinase [Lysobacter chinensis]MCF7220549.1 serine/threonine-protein kinase [Lysobacter chinensis]
MSDQDPPPGVPRTPDPRQRIDALFEQALDLDEAARVALLDRETAGDPALRAEVEALLELAGREAPQLRPDALLEGALLRAWAAEHGDGHAAATGLDGDASGLQLGHWRLLRRLGQGGMGTVYLAERVNAGFRQLGALKRLHVALGSSEFLHRFAQERQILASLNHPGIARLLDGGRDDDGHPFLVMEYVEGEPLDRYCDDRRLDIGQRLALFVRICEAVAHAHRHLIVHRDIKPSNIVVTADGEVKLLDFGIAKVLGDAEAPLQPLTRTAMRVFTPEYAAPEQVTGAAATTATDVYQLGLLLYELLGGHRAQETGAGSAAALERAICDSEPVRPSQRIDSEVAAARGTTASALRRRLRGDLDNIVLKALRKVPERRYDSALALAEDIGRWRRRRPVHARPEGIAYRGWKFVRRHPFGIAASAAMLAMLVAYAVTVTRQANTIAHERDRAQAEATKARQVQALVLQLFEGADPTLSGGTKLSARELLDRGWEGIERELGGQPEARAELLDTVGEAYRQLGEYERAGPLFTQALSIAREHAGTAPLQLARALRSRGRLHSDLGEFEQAEALLRDALAHYRRALGEPHVEIANTLGDLGFMLTRAADYPAAERVHRDALEMRRRLFGNEHPDVADSLVKLGMALRNQGNYAAAEPLLSEALAIRRRLLPPSHPHLAHNMSDLALLRADLGEYDSAESLYRESLTLTAHAHGRRHPHVATVLNNLARLLQAQRRFDEAESLLREALDIRRQALGDIHHTVAMNLNDLGQVRAEAGDLESAEQLYLEALSTYAPDHPWRAATISNLGQLAERRGDLLEAERLYVEALEGQRNHYGADHDRVANVLVPLGTVLHRQGRLDDAEASLRQALDIYRLRLRPGHPRVAGALLPLGLLLAERGRDAEATALLEEAVRIRHAAYGDGDVRTTEATQALTRLRRH